MPGTEAVECAFLVPLRRDAELSDGRRHSASVWQWLDAELYERFQGRTVAPGWYEGVYRDPDTRQPVHDKSRKYVVAVPTDRVDDVRELLRQACWYFRQKCIYLSVAGRVEFVEP